MGVLRPFGAPLSVMALCVVAACAVPGGARAAVPVDCANPQAPRAPLADASPIRGRARGRAGPHAAAWRRDPRSAGRPLRPVGRPGPAGGACCRWSTPTSSARRPHLAERIVEYAAGDTPAQAAAAVAAPRRGGASRSRTTRSARRRCPTTRTCTGCGRSSPTPRPDAPRRAGRPAGRGRVGAGRAAPACGWRSSTPASTRARGTSTAACCGIADDPARTASTTTTTASSTTPVAGTSCRDQQNVGDDGGHGTHVAGIIGARSDNGVTVTGLASGVAGGGGARARRGVRLDLGRGGRASRTPSRSTASRVVNLSLAGSSWSQLHGGRALRRYPERAVRGGGRQRLGATSTPQPAYPCDLAACQNVRLRRGHRPGRTSWRAVLQPRSRRRWRSARPEAAAASCRRGSAPRPSTYQRHVAGRAHGQRAPRRWCWSARRA